MKRNIQLRELGENGLILEEALNVAPKEDCHPINLYKLADISYISRSEALGILLKTAHKGDLYLHWVFHCPNCGQPVDEQFSLSTVDSKSRCLFCSIDIENSLSKNCEILFTFKKHLSSKQKRFYKKLKKEGDKEWAHQYTIFAVDVITNQVYRDLYRGDLLPAKAPLPIDDLTIMFLTITNANFFYETLKPAQAYRLIRHYLDFVDETVKGSEGALLRNTNDGMVAVFREKEKSVAAAIEMQEKFHSYNRSVAAHKRVYLKIALHSGGVLAATIGNCIDLVGTTVNVCSKVNELAEAGDIVISDTTLDSKSLEMIQKKTKSIHSCTLNLEGVSNKLKLYRFATL